MADGLSSGKVVSANFVQQNTTNVVSPKYGYVYSIILDEENPISKKLNAGSAIIGSVRFRQTDNLQTPDGELPIAYPYDKNIKTLPVRNELVEILDISGTFYYRRANVEANPTISAESKAISKLFNSKEQDKESGGNAKQYQEKIDIGIPNTNSTDDSKTDGLGDYYEPVQGIHKLKLYEGDTLLESRFGQSIRLSAYNNTKNIFSPTIIIRNNENYLSNKIEDAKSTEEDINRDSSVIVLSSGQYQLPFLPGTVDDKGSSDFSTKPESFENYPDKLIGDQILINSGRIILSAKNAEMLFYSKKNYGFISDGALSIDNKLGIDISVGDDFNIITNDRQFQILSGKGSIFLGSKEQGLEPMVKGQKLVELLAELIDAITQQIYLTPSGPSATGPQNISQFGTIKSKLNDVLSKLNQTT
jgi:hypothetical protein